MRGEIRFHTDVIGDQVLLRSDGYPAYNFAVVVDDGLMAVTHVVRGEDHISNTPRQMLIYEALGLQPPEFGHVAMVLGPDHTKLSKRHGAVSVDEFREKGYLPEALLNYLALLSWSPGKDQEIVPLAEMAKRFSLSDVGHSASVFDEEKLAWVNRHYLKDADLDRLATLTVPYFERTGYINGAECRWAALPREHRSGFQHVSRSPRSGSRAASPALRVLSGVSSGRPRFAPRSRRPERGR